MTTYPLTTLGPVISSNGISIPSFQDILLSLQASYEQIFGSDVQLDPDTQDGQWLSVMAQAIYDCNQACVAVYNQFSPATAVGAGLSSLVKQNGLTRDVATNSTAPGTIVGRPGTELNNCTIGDNLDLNTVWSIPNGTLIPPTGQVDVTVTCTTQGAIAAAEGTLTVILTPTFGWQTVTNTADATPGAPVEDDAQLRQRQSISTSLPALTPFDSTLAAVGQVTGVERFFGYENDTELTDANGIPPHSISIVVAGGDETAIATAISQKKTPGCGTYGTTSITVSDSYGIPKVINFFELEVTDIYVIINGNALNGWNASTEQLIIDAVTAFINGLVIGGTVFYNKLWSPANLSGSAAQNSTGFAQTVLDQLSDTYDITELFIGIAADPVGTVDIPIAFNFAAVTANVTVDIS
jgi:uncharacterized phage protein gp47/JayE